MVSPLDYPQWDEWVGAWDEATSFHSSAWCRTLVETYGYRPCYAIMKEEGGSLRAVLPMMEVRGMGGRRRGVSLPFTDVCGMLVRNGHDGVLLMDAIRGAARLQGWRTIEFRGAMPADEKSSPIPAISFVTHTVDLGGTEDELWNRCRPAVRRAIRKAREAGLEVECGSGDDFVNAFYYLFTLTRRRHGLPPPPRDFFRSFQRHMLQSGAGTVVMARRKGEPVAASIFLCFGGHALFKYGASDHRYQGDRPNDLVMWEGLRWCRGQGCHAMSLGKTRTVQEGLRRFKMGWGGNEDNLDYFVYDVSENKYVVCRDEVDGWYNVVFRRMPLPMLRWAGRLLYPYAA